jgi:phage-related protein
MEGVQGVGCSVLGLSDFQAVYYRDRHGEEPVRQFVDGLDEDTQAAIENQIDRLNLLSDEVPHLPFPHSSQIDGELRELRCHYGRQLYRILYRRSDRLLVLLSVFAKRSAKVPEGDVRLAQQRWQDFKARMDAERRLPPRAAGHDAP